MRTNRPVGHVPQAALLLSILAVAGSGSCAATPLDTFSPPTLRQLADIRGFTLGTALWENEAELAVYTNNPTYRQTVAAQYNNVNGKGQVAFLVVHPGPQQYDFRNLDELVRFAQANGMSLHGTALLYWQGLPSWLTTGTFTKAQLLAVAQDHITTVVSRYRGEIATWDVVNEVLNDAGDGFRSSIWLNTIGPEYIDSAFVWARRADPGARLYLNEWGAEGTGTKADAVFGLAQTLKSRGVPIDGVGFQAHFTVTNAPLESDMSANLARFADAGFDVRVSELDVRLADSAGPDAFTRQAIIYRDVLDACLRQARCVGFTSWGFSDRYSWIPIFFPGFGRALPLDTAYTPKPAYDSLIARLSRP